MSQTPTGDGAHRTHTLGRVPGSVRRVARGVVVLCVVAAGLALAPAGASAQSLNVLVSNSSETSAGGHTVAADELIAASFTTGANPSGYWLSAANLPITATAAAVVTVAIYGDSSGSPDTSLATLTRVASSGLFSAGGAGVELAANTTYWVVIDKGTGGMLSVGQTRSDDQTGEAGWSIGDAWQNKTGTGAWTESTEGKTLRLQVRGEARPPILVDTTGAHSASQQVTTAQYFIAGSHTAGYAVFSVGVYVSATGGAVPSVEISADNVGRPGTVLHTLTASGTADASVATEEIFTASGVDLDPGGGYWVVVANSASSGTMMVSTQDQATESVTGATGWTVHGNAARLTGVNTWSSASNMQMRMAVYGAAITNSAPVFAAETAARSVRENTYVGQVSDTVTVGTFSGNVFDAVTATDVDGDRLVYSVAATSDSDAAAHLAAFHEDFTLNTRTGQVSIKAGALIDFEDRSSYKVKLQVSDNKDRVGRADPAVDDTTTLTITVDDVADERPHTTGPPRVGSPGSDCVWTPGEDVVVTLNFNEPVTVDITGGTPSLTAELYFDEARTLEYDTGSGTRDLTFTYEVASGDVTSGSSLFILRVVHDSLVLNGGSITSTASTGTSADLRIGPAVGGQGDAPRSVGCAPWPVPGAKPTVTAVEVSGAWENGPDAGTWGNGRPVDVWLTFSEAVDVFSSGQPVYALANNIRRHVDPPTVTIKTTFGARTAEWAYAGPATNRLRFRYWPAGSDGFLDEVELVANSLTLNDTTIRSAATGQSVAAITHEGTGSVTPQTLLVSNDNEEEGDRRVAGDNDPITFFAQGFTTGSDAMTLGGVRLRGRFTDDLTVSIHSSTTGTLGTQTGQTIPGASLATLTNPGPLTYYHWVNVSDYYYFRSPGGVQLGANTTYFVVITEGTAGAQEVQPLAATSAGTGQTGMTGWTIDDKTLGRDDTESSNWDSHSVGGPLMLSLWGTPGGASGSQSTPGGGDGRSTRGSGLAPGVSGSQATPAEEDVVPFSATFEGLPASHDGSNAFTVTLRLSRDPDALGYRDILAGLVFVKGATLTGVRRSVPGSDRAWALTVVPNQRGDVVLRVLPRPCESTLAFCAGGEPLSESVFETVAGPDTAPATAAVVNSPHTGGPTISGTAQVGQTLTADTTAIVDADGITEAVFAYQWIRQDLTTALSENISGATAVTYTVTAADLGSVLRVLVTFTDDAGNSEESISQEVTVTAAPDPQSDTQQTPKSDPPQSDPQQTRQSGPKEEKTPLPQNEDTQQQNIPQEAPAAPTELTATANTAGQVVLDWVAPDDDDSVSGYVILRRRPTMGENTLSVYVADTASTATAYTDTDVTAGIVHVYRVKAINAAGESGWSNYANSTPQQPQAPAAPTELTATVNTDGHIVLEWEAPADDSVTGYVILRRRSSEGENTLSVYVADTASTATAYTDTDVTAGVQHVYRVKAINAAGQSLWSNYANTTPQ